MGEEHTQLEGESIKMRPSGSLRTLLLALTAAGLFGLTLQSHAQDSPPDSEYAPLRLYQGAWEITPKSAAAGAKPDHLQNQCDRIGKYFACQQTVNGKVSALVIFIPAGKSGHYFTQAVMAEGGAGGRGELEIAGDDWTYLGKDEENGKTTYYRTTNHFTGKDHIHFEQAESSDGKNWTVKGSGDETRGGS
jgi:hypothetical protein